MQMADDKKVKALYEILKSSIEKSEETTIKNIIKK
jgi:hypothetical protein